MTNKKRTAEGGVPPAMKRRKPSTISVGSIPGSAHPLRQTSFPPDDPMTSFSARSPSVDFDNMSLVSGSQVSAAQPFKKKRGRKSKAEKAREETPSVVGGRVTAAASIVSDATRAGTKSAAGGAGGDEGEADDDGPTEVAATGKAQTKEQKEEEQRLKSMLIGAFTEEQFDRYENFRAVNLNKTIVRRLVNATVSQSVQENVVIGMRAVAKMYLGDIIESARRVQGEWIQKMGENQTELPTPPATAAPSPNTNVEPGDQANATTAEVDDRRGPLRPEHLREAVRRYKKGGEGGIVGMQLLWNQQQHNGVERFPTRTGGRRIFR
ncbi:hTAFII28-like protein conserved region-domain-containing protein [Podospora fimiseda]|uniref:HTAFII28-like protein conserved region-domain-containing protein n=1 Tax=Podospora fimiseda TaxID=252190 RepID=A0AAN7BVV1_9PEZI|nr:hTAFII28-like protein conserved region-domain-containing protein [Podospora fimiseda]